MRSSRSEAGGGAPAPLPGDFGGALAGVRSRLGRLGTAILYFPIVASTNDTAAALAAREGAEGTVVFADAQTRGRGRLGREWASPPGSGLYVSVVLAPVRHAAREPERATRLLTLAAGVALAGAVETATGLAPDVKWPNDLYVGRRKLAGILAEAPAGASDRVVLGYGINVGATAFPPSIASRATALEAELGRPVDRAHLFAESLAALARVYDDLLEARFDAILDAWRARSPSSVGARVRWTTPSGDVSGTTAGIDADGALLVQTGQAVQRVLGGEIFWS